MGKHKYATKGNRFYHSTVAAPNNAVEFPDLKSNHRGPNPRIALLTVFTSSTDESSELILCCCR